MMWPRAHWVAVSMARMTGQACAQVQAEHVRNPAACPLPTSAFVHIEDTFYLHPHDSADLSHAVRSHCR